MYHYFNIVSDRFTREIIQQARATFENSSVFASLYCENPNTTRYSYLFLFSSCDDNLARARDPTWRWRDPVFTWHRSTVSRDIYRSHNPFSQITQSRFSIFRRMPNSSLDLRLASRENKVFPLEKKKKKKNIAWSRKGLKTRQWIFCTTSKFVSMDGRRNRRKVFSIDGWNWRIRPDRAEMQSGFRPVIEESRRRRRRRRMACVRARPPLTPFLLSRLIVCPQSRKRRGELFAEANADYFFVAGATKLITGGNFSPRHGRRIDSSVSVLIKRIPSEIPQREFNARCYSRSHDSRCDSCYRRWAICRTENCLHSFFLWDHPSSIVIIGT